MYVQLLRYCSSVHLTAILIFSPMFNLLYVDIMLSATLCTGLPSYWWMSTEEFVL